MSYNMPLDPWIRHITMDLQRAAPGGDTERVAGALAAGADPHATPLTKSGNGEIALMLIQAGADPCREFLGQVDSPEVARVLVAHGADVHARLGDGRTALHGALAQLKDFAMDPEVANIFVDAGADPLAVDNQGRTPLALHSNSSHAKAETLEVLRAAESRARMLQTVQQVQDQSKQQGSRKGPPSLDEGVKAALDHAKNKAAQVDKEQGSQGMRRF